MVIEPTPFALDVHLRNVQAEDRWKVRDWRNDPGVSKYLFTNHHISPEMQEAWFASVVHDQTRKYWIIVVEGRDAGLAHLYDISPVHKRSSWGLFLNEERTRGKGIGSLVQYAVHHEVFEVRKLNKLCCEVLATNDRAMRMYKFFGFREEGLLRAHVRKDDAFHDVFALALLRSEWERMRPLIEQRLRARGLLKPESTGP